MCVLVRREPFRASVYNAIVPAASHRKKKCHRLELMASCKHVEEEGHSLTGRLVAALGLTEERAAVNFWMRSSALVRGIPRSF
jgi:hypothetical protein